MTNTQKKIFVSYKRDDSEFTLKLAKALADQGIAIWIDQLEITAVPFAGYKFTVSANPLLRLYHGLPA